MTAAVRPNVTGEDEALRLLKQGINVGAVVELTDVPQTRVQQLLEQIRPQTTSAPVPARFGTATPAPAARPVPAPPAPATGTYGKRASNLAARIVLDPVQRLLTQAATRERKDREDAARREREAKARAEFEQLERQLAEARARLSRKRQGEGAPAGDPLAWQAEALCAEVDAELFFPEKGGAAEPAKTVCRACDVRSVCLLYAVRNDERFGVWGGLSERERRPLHDRARRLG